MPPTVTPPAVPDSDHQRLIQLLEENLALTKENHKLLKTMRRSSLFWLIAKIIMWVALLILPLFFIQPLISAFTGELPSASGTSTAAPSSLFGFPSPAEIKSLMKQYKDASQ